MTKPDHTGATRDFFERRAGQWSGQYTAGGGMSDRVERFIVPLRARVAEGLPILDLGCGTGEIARAAGAWTVTAADLSANMLDQARRQAGAAAVTWVLLDGGPLPFADAAFSAVLSSSVLEYVADVPAHLAEVARVLDRGGWYLATVPDPRHSVRKAERFKQRLAHCGLVFGLISLTRLRSDYEYLRLSINRFALDRWETMLADMGLVCDAIEPPHHPLALLVARKQ